MIKTEKNVENIEVKEKPEMLTTTNLLLNWKSCEYSTKTKIHLKAHRRVNHDKI